MSLTRSLFLSDLVCIRQTLYHQAHPVPFLFSNRVSLCTPGWPGIHSPPASPPQCQDNRQTCNYVRHLFVTHTSHTPCPQCWSRHGLTNSGTSFMKGVTECTAAPELTLLFLTASASTAGTPGQYLEAKTWKGQRGHNPMEHLCQGTWKALACHSTVLFCVIGTVLLPEQEGIKGEIQQAIDTTNILHSF